MGKIRLQTYPAVERQGVIWVFVGDIEAPPLEDDVPPEFLERDAYVGGRVFEWPGDWRVAMEGAIDPSHPFYLHRSAWLSIPFRMPAARGKRRYAAFETFPALMQRVQARTRWVRPFTLARRFCRFGYVRRLVLLFAWLTLWPTRGALPQ